MPTALRPVADMMLDVTVDVAGTVTALAALVTAIAALLRSRRRD